MAAGGYGLAGPVGRSAGRIAKRRKTSENAWHSKFSLLYPARRAIWP